MMIVLLYLLNLVCSSGQSVLSKQYSLKGGSFVGYNLSMSASGLLFFLLWGLLFGMNLHIPSLIYGTFYGITLCFSMCMGFKALATGPIALTSIIASFSLVIPFVVGVAVWHEELTSSGIVGIVLLLLSILLINLKKEAGISLKWSIFTLLTMVSNGVCALIQKHHQIQYPSLYKTEFNLSAFVCAFLVLMAVKLVCFKRIKIRPSGMGFAAGLLNGGANYVLLLLSATEKASVLFPVSSVAKILAVGVIGVVFYKERLRFVQIIGLITGLAAIVLLNI